MPNRMPTKIRTMPIPTVPAAASKRTNRQSSAIRIVAEPMKLTVPEKKEAPAEEAKTEAAAEGSTEAPKRRRRRTRDEVTEPDESITKLIKEQGIANDYSDLPFEV